MSGRCGLFGLVWMCAVLPVAGQSGSTLSEEDELRLAMSAGPLALAAEADVYLMGRHGFTRAVSGTNGFSCLVVRTAGAPDILAPHCLNPAAVETVLPALLREGELQAADWGGQEIRAELDRQFEAGELPLPSGPAYAYMFSEGQYLGPNAGNFQPHFMLYIPNVSNADIAGDPTELDFPFVGPFENQPLSTVVIVTPEFVSPADVKLPSRWSSSGR